MSAIGIDEVGRGSWAGPLLVVAAKAIDDLPKGLKDSKLLNRQERELFYELLVISCQFGEGWVQPAEIDARGLTKALHLGAARALRSLGIGRETSIIIDGNLNYCPKQYKNVQAVIKADQTYPVVSAASIYAKVTRDRYMAEISNKHLGYGFEHNVGYGTQLHQARLKLNGPCSIHRFSYRPLLTYEK